MASRDHPRRRSSACEPTEQVGSAIAVDLMGHRAFAVQLLDGALANASPGSAGWLVPVEPLLNVSAHPDVWAPVLARLRTRAA